MSNAIWQEPPKTAWQERLEPLIERPGEWARVLDTQSVNYAHSLRYKLRNRALSVPPGRWQFRSAKHGDGGAVWAQYVGPEVNEPVAVTTG